jgi:hypothetical protein
VSETLDSTRSVDPFEETDVPAPSLVIPLFLFYLLAVATSGLFLAWWAYRLARTLDPYQRRERTYCLGWAVSVFFAPAAGALIYEVSRLAREERRALGKSTGRRSLAIAPVLFLALCIVLVAVTAAWTPLLLLLPLPFVIAQHDVNELEKLRSATVAVAAVDRARWLHLGLIAVGIPLTAFAFYKLDREVVLTLTSSHSRRVGFTAAIGAGEFDFTVPSDGWQQVAPGVVGDGTEALCFRKNGGDLWVLVYDTPESQLSLAAIVAARRSMIESESLKIQESREKRFFLEGHANLLPVSLSEHRVTGPNFQGVYQVLSVATGARTIEAIGFSNPLPTNIQDIQAFVMSFNGRKK